MFYIKRTKRIVFLYGLFWNLLTLQERDTKHFIFDENLIGYETVCRQNIYKFDYKFLGYHHFSKLLLYSNCQLLFVVQDYWFSLNWTLNQIFLHYIDNVGCRWTIFVAIDTGSIFTFAIIHQIRYSQIGNDVWKKIAENSKQFSIVRGISKFFIEVDFFPFFIICKKRGTIVFWDSSSAIYFPYA